MLKTEYLVKITSPILKTIIVLLCHIVLIYIKQQNICITFHFPSYQRDLPHWKGLLRCFSNVVVLSYKVSNSINITQRCFQQLFFVSTYYYHAIPFMKYFHMKRKQYVYILSQWQQHKNSKLYTWKDLVLMGLSIANFHNKFYITEIQDIELHLPHLLILGNHHCGK